MFFGITTGVLAFIGMMTVSTKIVNKAMDIGMEIGKKVIEKKKEERSK